MKDPHNSEPKAAETPDQSPAHYSVALETSSKPIYTGFAARLSAVTAMPPPSAMDEHIEVISHNMANVESGKLYYKNSLPIDTPAKTELSPRSKESFAARLDREREESKAKAAETRAEHTDTRFVAFPLRMCSMAEPSPMPEPVKAIAQNIANVRIRGYTTSIPADVSAETILLPQGDFDFSARLAKEREKSKDKDQIQH